MYNFVPPFREENFVVCCHVVLTNLNVPWVEGKVKARCPRGKIQLSIADETAVSSILRRYFLVEGYY
jgi:hypothetical protein